MTTADPLSVIQCPGCQRNVAWPTLNGNVTWQCPFCHRRFRRRLQPPDSSDGIGASAVPSIRHASHSSPGHWEAELQIPRRARLLSLALGAYAWLLLALIVTYHLLMTVLAAVCVVFCLPVLLWRTLTRDDGLDCDQSEPSIWLRPIANWLPHFRRTDSDLTIGPRLTREQAPGVFALTAEVARTVAAPDPDEIRITHLPCCGVLEQRRWCGLRRGRRVLVVGLPIFYVLTTHELRAALAHELAHLSSGDAALAFVVSQFLDSLDQSIARGSGTRWGWLNPCVLVARLVRRGFRVLASPLSRHQEYRADHFAALVCGSDVVTRSLRLVALVQPVFKEVLCHYHPTVVTGSNLYQFFSAAWCALNTEQKHAMQESLVSGERRHWFDPHPTLRARLAKLGGQDTANQSDDRPARELLTNRSNLEELLHHHIYRARTRPPSVFLPFGRSS